jgi:hypothetical protein
MEKLNDRRLNEDIYKLIFSYVKERDILISYKHISLFHRYFNKASWNEFFRQVYKTTYPTVYEIIQKEYIYPEDQLLEKKNNTTSWLLNLTQTANVRYSIPSSILRRKNKTDNNEQITIDNIELFAIRICNMHSWYKHLPNYPGVVCYVSHTIRKREEGGWDNNTRYFPTPINMHPETKSSCIVWDYNREDMTNKILFEKMIFGAYLNCYLSPRSGTSIGEKNQWGLIRDQVSLEIKGKEFFPQYVEIKNKKEEIVRMVEDIIDCCIRYVNVIYGYVIEKRQIFTYKYEEDVLLIEKGSSLNKEQLSALSPKYEIKN